MPSKLKYKRCKPKKYDTVKATIVNQPNLSQILYIIGENKHNTIKSRIYHRGRFIG